MTQDDVNVNREAVCICETLRMTLCLETSSHNILVQSVASIMVLDNPGECSLINQEKSNPPRYPDGT